QAVICIEASVLAKTFGRDNVCSLQAQFQQPKAGIREYSLKWKIVRREFRKLPCRTVRITFVSSAYGFGGGASFLQPSHWPLGGSYQLVGQRGLAVRIVILLAARELDDLPNHLLLAMSQEVPSRLAEAQLRERILSISMINL